MATKYKGFTEAEYQKWRDDAQKEGTELCQWLHNHGHSAPAILQRYARQQYQSALDDIAGYDAVLSQLRALDRTAVTS